MNILIQDILAILPGGPETCSVTVQDGIITSVSAVPEGFVPDKTISGKGRMLIPGLVNAHTHVYMTVFRNCADDLLFNDWLFERIMPLEDKLTAEDCYWGTLLGYMEMLSTGTTASVDMYIFSDAAARAATESGVRAVLSRGLSGGADDVDGGKRRIREALAEIDAWKGHENLKFMLAPHAPYTCDLGYQREIAALARERGLAIHTHLAESLAEIETIRGRYNCSPIELADQSGLLTETTVAAHCVQLTDEDIALLAARGVSVATNPVSNLKLANGVARVCDLMKAGVNVALGTDSAGSNNSLNMFRDLSFLTLLQKGVLHDAQAVTAQEGFLMATKNGARAAGLHGVGEIAVGMKADLAILSLDHPNMQPMNNPVAALAYSASGHEVETVMVGGKLLMENREFLTIDKERVLFEVNKVCERIGTR